MKEASDTQQQKQTQKPTLKAGELVNSVTTYLRTQKHLLTSVNIKLR